MLYVTAHLRPDSSWSLAARLYLRSLALLPPHVLPFRLLWTAVAETTRQRKGGVFQSFGDVFDPDALPQALKPLRPHFGPGSPPVRPSAMLFVGEVVDAVERISHHDSCPPKNAVLTSWPASTIPLHLAIRLSAYDVVLVPEGEGQRFVDSDVPRVVEVPWPAPLTGELSAAKGVLKPPAHVQHMFCTAGTWNGEDNVQQIVEAFLANFTRADGVGLSIACPDFPREWVASHAGKAGRETLPFVHVMAPFGMGDDPTAVDKLFMASHVFVDASRRVSSSFWRKRAESLGCSVIDLTQRGVVPYAGGNLWHGVHAGQGWRELLSPEATASALRAGVSRGLRPAVMESATGSVLAENILRVLQDVPVVETVRPAARPAAPLQSAKDGIGIVVPFSGEGEVAHAGLQRCLGALKAALRPQDKLVISCRTPFTKAAVRHLADLCGLEAATTSIIHSTSGGDRWNMSAVRNAGVRRLMNSADVTELAYVAFVDADVAVPPDYLQRLAREAYKRPGMVVTPYVVDEGDTEGKTRRIASGMSMYPLKVIFDARGFDEGFVGWGHEDIELQHRLRERFGVPSVALPNMAPALHTPHAARGGDEQRSLDDAANRKRYEEAAKRLDAGDESYAVNDGDSWGAFAFVE